MRALVKVGYRCNHRCVFCHADAARDVEAPRAEIDERIDRAARLGHRGLVLSGGEPTLRPELLNWADRVAARGMELGLVTNGALLDDALVDALVRRGLRYVHLSLHGGTAALHDAAVGAPSFARVLGALRALSGRGVETWVNCVVTRRNLDALDGVVDAVRPFRDAALKLSLVEPRGAALAAFDALVPTVTEAAAAVRRALALARAGSAPLRVAHDYLPLCLLPGWEDARGDLRAHGFWSMAEVGEPDLCPVDERNTVKPERCGPCVLRGRCPGLFTGYHARHGDGELAPVTGRPRSNSFNYVYEGRLAAAPADGACPVLALGVDPWDRARHLFVRNGERVARFRADTRDFDDAQVADVKHRSGQLYVDASRKDAPDDFARDLVKLRRWSGCEPCPERARCTGLFEPAREEVFARDDARVLELLGGLAGDVLDVGCGDGRYGDALAAGAASGRIRYTGVEPDRAQAARMRERWPWASVVEAPAEALRLDGARFDHGLVLRSWNHLAHPGAVVRALAAALREAGTLTLVDNEAFGLARTRPHAARAEGSAAALEHLRNDGAREAHATVAAVGLLDALELVERRDVGPDTSNQWLLRYRVRPGKASPPGAP
jgi:MoaA/NifB/PqqE/SkfB family radical SAM enzyme/SAM-dependent methyltransferase